jgi:hypothetical protein
LNKEISSLNNIITEYFQEIEEINKTFREKNNKLTLDSQKILNKITVFIEGKKFNNQKLSENDRFLRDSLLYMNRYGKIMDKIIDTRTNYLLRKKSNGNNKLENLIDNRDISTKSLENDKNWGSKDCKKI